MNISLRIFYLKLFHKIKISFKELALNSHFPLTRQVSRTYGVHTNG